MLLMVRGQFKSRTFRRIFKRVPSGKVKKFYVKRENDRARCVACHNHLSGIPTKYSKLSATQKRPQRPFGGYYCSKCTREHIKNKIRVL